MPAQLQGRTGPAAGRGEAGSCWASAAAEDDTLGSLDGSRCSLAFGMVSWKII